MPVLPDQLLGDVVDAAHRGDDPQLVADARLAPGAAEAPEGPGSHLGQVVGLVAVDVFPVLGQAGAHVVDVDPLSRGDVLSGQADGAAVFDNGRPGGDGGQGDFVAPLDGLGGGELPPVHSQRLPLEQVLQGHGHIVGGVDSDQLHARHSFMAS